MKPNLLVVFLVVVGAGLSACGTDTATTPTPAPFDVAEVAAMPALAPNVLPPEATPHGKTYAEWTAAWWRWLWSAPPAVNPGLDATGENIDYGQSGPVWFLAPNYGGVDVREATIPTGKALFVDVAGWFTSPVIGDPSDPAELIATAEFLADNTTGVTLEIDGVAVADIDRFRVTTDLFEYTIPEDNMFTLFGIPTPGGTYFPGVSSGWFVMIPPLSAGEHTIRMFAELPFGSGVSDVTVNLTVAGPGRAKKQSQQS